MAYDARLMDPVLLWLAAWNLTHGPPPPPPWPEGEGLAALLAYARRRPRRDLDAADLEASGSLGRLLAEARAWQQEGPHAT